MPKVLFLKTVTVMMTSSVVHHQPRQLNPAADKEEKRKMPQSSRKKLKGDDERDLCRTL